jgi:hypothetical protein
MAISHESALHGGCHMNVQADILAEKLVLWTTGYVMCTHTGLIFESEGRINKELKPGPSRVFIKDSIF